MYVTDNIFIILEMWAILGIYNVTFEAIANTLNSCPTSRLQLFMS